MITFTILCILTFIYLNYKLYKTREEQGIDILDRGVVFFMLYYVSGSYILLLALVACFVYLP